MATTDPGWVRMSGSSRCTRCGSLVEASWRYFASAKTWTFVMCEPCLEKVVNLVEAEANRE